MPSLVELLKIESSVEDAVCAFLTKSALAVPQFSDKKRQHPAYEVKLSNVEEGELYFIREEIKYPQEWKAMLSIRTVTQRYHNSELQPAMLANVRMMRFRFLFLFEKLLPFHYITWMKESGGARQHTEDKFDLTDQQFAIKVRIRDEHLPVKIE